MTVRIAVIGAGVMGADHARIVAEEMRGAKLQVVCDSDEPRARRVAYVCGAADVGTDPEAVIARDDVDAVIIASPDSTHAPLSLACIRRRKKVLCEKPLSQLPEQCLEIMAAEQGTGEKFVQVGFMRRFERSYLEMKQALADGKLGRALMMHNFHRNVETPATEFTGAMAITNSAPHEFDIVRHVLGAEYRSITAFQPKRSDKRVAPVVMVLETTDDQLATIEINNNAAYGYDVRAELVGERASVAMNHVAYTRLEEGLGVHASYDTDWRSRYFDAYRRQNRAFLRFVETGRFPEGASSAWDGYVAAEVARTGVLALEGGERQAIHLVDRPDFYG